MKTEKNSFICGCDFSAQRGDNYHGWQSHPTDEDRKKTPSSVGVTSPRSAEIITTDGKAIPRMKTEKKLLHPWDGLAIRGISIVAAVAAEGSLRRVPRFTIHNT